MDDKVIVKLAEAALSGDKKLGQMVVRQLASKIRVSNENLYEQLSEKLSVRSTRAAEIKAKPLPVDTDSRQTLVRVEDPVSLEAPPVHSNDVGEAFEQILLERMHAEELLNEGITPTRSMIFQGAPGVGKTMSARWIAKKLNLPLLTLDLATVMSSFLGKTGSNVRAVLEYAVTTPCVLLLDEFDAIAKRRDDDRELGELKRLVTVLLQAIDDWPTSSLLIAATNHGELLDPAIWRRFDAEIHFPMPSTDIINNYLKAYWPDALENGRTAKHFLGMSFSNIDRELKQAKRERIISNFNESLKRAKKTSSLSAKDKTENLSKDDRNSQVLRLFDSGKSQRFISSELGISRPTVKKVLEENSKL